MATYNLQDVKALKERRKLAKITSTLLAKAAGMRFTRYMQIEDGLILPSDVEWREIEIAFQIILMHREYDAGRLNVGDGEQNEALRKLAKWNTNARGK